MNHNTDDLIYANVLNNQTIRKHMRNAIELQIGDVVYYNNKNYSLVGFTEDTGNCFVSYVNELTAYLVFPDGTIETVDRYLHDDDDYITFPKNPFDVKQVVNNTHKKYIIVFNNAEDCDDFYDLGNTSVNYLYSMPSEIKSKMKSLGYPDNADFFPVEDKAEYEDYAFEIQLIDRINGHKYEPIKTIVSSKSFSIAESIMTHLLSRASISKMIDNQFVNNYNININIKIGE